MKAITNIAVALTITLGLSGCIQVGSNSNGSSSGDAKKQTETKRGMIFSSVKYKSLDLSKIFDVFPNASRLKITVEGAGTVSFDVTDLNGGTHFNYYDADKYYVTVVDDVGTHEMEIRL